MAKNTKKTAKKTTAKKPAGKPATKKPSAKKPTTKKTTKTTAKKPTSKRTTKATPKRTSKPTPKKPSARKTTGKTTRKTTPKKAKTTPKQKTSGAKKTNGRGKKTPAKRKTTSDTKSSDKKSVKQEELVTVVIKTHYDKKGGHPHVIIADVDKNHVSIGLTSDKYKGKNSPNYKLKVNPLGGDETSYMKRQGTVDNKSRYFNRREGVMNSIDKEKANQYGERALDKYNKNKK